MKKVVACFLIVAVVFSFSACGTSPAPATPSPKPTMDYKNYNAAKELAKKDFDYMGKSLMVYGCPNEDVVSVDVFKIGSIDVDTTKDNYTTVTISGLFFGEDKYGNDCGKYNFDCIYTIEEGGSYSRDIEVVKPK